MRPVFVILLSILLVMVSLYGGFAAGGWVERTRADSLAHSTLRNLGFVVMESLPPVVAADGRRQHVWPESLRLPLGVYALHDRAAEPIRIGQEPAVPVACISPGYDPDVFIVLFSNFNREKLTRVQLEKLLGIEGFSLENYDLSGFYKGARAL